MARTRTSWQWCWVERRVRGMERETKTREEDWSPWLKTSHGDKNLPAINWYDSGTRCRRVRSRSAPAVTVRPCISRNIFLWRLVDDSFVSCFITVFPNILGSCLLVQKKIKRRRRRANVSEDADKEGITLAPRRNVPQVLTGTVVPGKACREASCRKSPQAAERRALPRKLSLRARNRASPNAGIYLPLRGLHPRCQTLLRPPCGCAYPRGNVGISEKLAGPYPEAGVLDAGSRGNTTKVSFPLRVYPALTMTTTLDNES